ncbi:DUF4157 domain-containing protein [Mesorhizobium sp. BR1-1-16]|uniref:eCIS core domain-containing protein n=1 Tax=Mesorhizobium sp. BR1-1-16 TaxID=2876653 RepID=UPI001CC9A1C0|nr:DUF4157 domain-containing protein [Mesorhizobium sp. BR1-1-16]MBZ9935659.1 DUF4157 domain-containing protein [Mesorhizobium sp. BR1-1-16]
MASTRAPVEAAGHDGAGVDGRSASKVRRIAPSNHAGERDADAMAARVVTRFDSRPVASPGQASPGPVTGEPAPPLVETVLGQSGQALDRQARGFLEPRFGRDFSNVRIHNDQTAHGSAAAIGARAFTSGDHVVFGRGQWRPDTAQGLHLLAHELAHGAGKGTGDRRTVWRKSTLDISDFDAGSFTDASLLAYLTKLRSAKVIEDKGDSDDKARGVVRKWVQGGDDFVLEPELKVLLIREMQSGFTGDDDERAILNLLEKSARPDVEAMFGPGQLDPEDLDDDFHGAEEDALRAFYDRLFIGGRKAALDNKVSGFAAVADKSLAPAYVYADLRALIDERFARMALIVRDRPVQDRDALIDDFARAESGQLQAQLALLSSADQALAGRDMSRDRARKDAQSSAIDSDIAKAPTQAEKDTLGRRKMLLQGEVLLLDLSLQAAFRDVAMAAPSAKAAFQNLATPLDAATKKAANEAIAPQTTASIEAEAKGVAVPPAPVFKPGPLPGETDTYEDKIKKRIPGLIKAHHDAQAKSRTEVEHKDPTKSRSMNDMQVVANQAKDEVDLVFGHLYDASKFKAFQGDKRTPSGVLTKKGNLRDVWQVEQDRRKANPQYEKASAKFWLFYLIQNDNDASAPDSVANTNTAHDASPSFGDDSVALNDEAKAIRKVGDPFVISDKRQLFEIGRGWDAFQQGGDIFIQLFKNASPVADRVFLWDMYFVLMHEYLHKLAAKAYHDYADDLGGEHSTQGNTLIEGVDSLLTEIAWSSAVQHAGTPEVRGKVEPDAVKAGLPFDINLLPKVPHRRYANYENAVRLAGVVGIHNLYAAYFQGRIDLIGGP